MKALSRKLPLAVRIIQLVLLSAYPVTCSVTETKIGGTYTSSHTLSLASSPFVATGDITVSKGATLTVEAGVQINLQARVRLHVRGTLVARGSPDNEILMFHNMTVGVDSGSIRLVGGTDLKEGRVEVFNGQKWGTVCDDHWNANHARVVCRHLGFGRPVETSTRRFGQGSGIIGLANLDCRGTENSLFDCQGASNWNNNRCQHSEDVGVVCGTVGVGYWGGIVFYPDDSTESVVYNALKYSSNSVLENVKISNAGVTVDNINSIRPDLQVPAITMTTVGPRLDNVSVVDSSHIGIQMNTLHSDVRFSSLTVENSSSSGIVGSCSWHFYCDGCRLYDNGVAGIDVTSIPPILKQPPTSSTTTYQATSSSSTSFSVSDSGAYLAFSKGSFTNDYRSSISTTSGYGLVIAFQRFSLSRGTLYVIDGVTKRTVLSVSGSTTPGTITIPSNRAIFVFDPYYYSSSSANIMAFISRYPIGSRGESLTDCRVTGRGRWSSGIRLTGSTGLRSVVKSTVTGTTGNGIDVSGSANRVTMSFANVVNARSSGISVNSRHAALNMIGCQIEGCQTGINLYSYSSNVLVSNCTVRHSSYRGAYIYWSYYYNNRYPDHSDQPGLQVSDCKFSDTPSNQALYVYLYNRYAGVDLRVNITRNVFERNLQGLYFNRYYRGISAVIDGNSFLDNDGGCCSGALDVDDRFYYSSSTHSPVIVENNVFTENTGEYVARLQTRTSFSSSYQLADSILVFRDNNVTRNTLSPRTTTGIYRWNVKSTPNAVILIIGTLFTTVYHNVLDNPNATLELAVQIDGFSSLDRINVSHNWWGTVNEIKIREKIFDFDDSNRLAMARYFPFLLSPSISDVAPSAHPRIYSPFVKNNGEIGGQLATDVSLSAVGGPYLVTRDITILPNGTLTLEAGTVLAFEQFVGVLVEGSLISNGTPDNPVVFMRALTSRPTESSLGTQTVVRLAEGNSYSRYAYGYVELRIGGIWHPICVRSLESNYALLDRISSLTCQQLGYDEDQSYASWWWSNWFPALGDSVVHSFWCPENTSSFSNCTYNTSTYNPHSDCLQLLYVRCYCWSCPYNSYPSSFGSNWAGIRFAPTSSIPTGVSSHRTPKSVLNYTEIRGAGRRYHTTVPSVQAIFRPPTINGLTIQDSASTAMEVSYLHEEAVIRGIYINGASGDGLAIRRPQGKDLTLESVTVHNATGAGIKVYDWTTSLIVNSDYQSICSGQRTIIVDPMEGSYVGMSQEDHLAGITCSVVLQGPPNTVLSVRVVSLRLYSDDNLYIRDGDQSTGSLLRSYQGYSSSSLGDLTISTGNKVLLEVHTGQKTGAPGFGLYVDAVDANRGPPSVSITNTSVYNSQYGVYFQNVYDDAVIENVTVVDALNHGVYIYSHEGKVTVANCFIVNAGSIGVYDIYGVGKTTIIDNVIVNSPQGIGFYVYSWYFRYRQSDCHLTMSRNRISGARTRAAYLYVNDYYNRYSCSLQVSENSIVSSNSGLFLQVYNSRYYSYNNQAVYVDLSKNVFSDNDGTDVSLSQSSSWNMSVTDNKFERHRTGSGGCLLLQGYATSLKATNNNFTGNRGTYVVRLAPENITNSPFVFENNELKDNCVNDSGSHRVDTRSAVLGIAQSQQVVIQNNHFSNPESLFELGIEIPVQSSTERVIDVTRNYWGTTDENVIVDRIHDFDYCSRLAPAQYLPYLESASGRPVSSSTTSTVEITRSNGILRGRVTKDTTLSVGRSPYVVTGDITVLPGRKLTIEAGVELRFTQNTGILVEGQLIVDGTPSSSVLLTDDSLAVNQNERYGLRLVGGPSPERGRVDVFYNGSWGPVCVVQNQRPRPRTSHDYYNTRVVCRELGYDNAYWQSSYVDPFIANSARSAWLEHVLCRGNEDTLRQCANYVLKKATCRHGQLVAWCRSYSYDNALKRDKAFTHWTGVRFAAGATDMSSLRHVTLNSAGIANAGHIPAIQAFGRSVELYNVTVTDCAWTGIEISHCDFSNISHSNADRNGGTGVQLINTGSSSVASLTSENNMGHGLVISVDSIPQRMWNIPVLHKTIVDICAHSGSLSATSAFFLRFSSNSISKRSAWKYCSATVRASSKHILHVHVMAIRFRHWTSITIDSTTIYSGGLRGPLHYSSRTGSVTITLSAYLYEFSTLEENYFLAYIEEHSTKQISMASHHIANALLVKNTGSGLAVNTSEDSDLRYDLRMTDSILSDNELKGMDVVATSGGDSGYGSTVHTLDFERNVISDNGLLTARDAYYSTVNGGGIAMQIDKSNVVIVNNAIETNKGGGVTLQLDDGSESSSISVSRNQIEGNTGGPALSLSGSSGTTGPRASVTDNNISHNSGGILYDTLSIDGVVASVAGNTLFNDTGRHVLCWETGRRHSVSGQKCSNNTFYLNVGQKPNYRWTAFVSGVAAKYNGNVFVNPANLYEFVAGQNLHQGNHDAKNNWWGTADVTKANQRVLDGSDESVRARVDVQPIDTVGPWSRRAVCSFGWEEYNSSCYLYVKGARRWSVATEYCRGLGGELATSLSSAAYNILTNSWSTTREVWSKRNGQQLCAVQSRGGTADEDCNLHRPFLCKKASAGDCPNSCSRNGQCNKQRRTCLCYRGWTGSDCSDFDCSEVNDCSGYGTCVGPNQCRCRVGWKGRACTTTYCGLYTTCHSCSRQPGCGWCDETQHCIPGLGTKPDKQSCPSWFYYACYSPVTGLQCSSRIKEIECNGPCDWGVATSSNETCQHCHDIERCYNMKTTCPSWNEDRCPYGRVTPDYGLGLDAPKIPSHLPLPHTRGKQRTKRQMSATKSHRRSSVDLFPDVKVFGPDKKIYRMLGLFKSTNLESLLITKPPLHLFRGYILASNQSGGILHKVSAVGKIGSYQLIRGSPASLEDVIKYADFSERVTLSPVIHESAVEITPNVRALQQILNSTSSSLPGASRTLVIPDSVVAHKCVGDWLNGTYVVAIPKSSEILVGGEGIVSGVSSGFIEIVQSIEASGGHTFVHTRLAECSVANAPLSVKSTVQTVGNPPTSVSPSITGIGGDGRLGLLLFENHLPSNLQLSVGDALVGRPSGAIAGYVKHSFDSFDDKLTYIELEPSSGIGKPLCGSLSSNQIDDSNKGDDDLDDIVITVGTSDISQSTSKAKDHKRGSLSSSVCDQRSMDEVEPMFNLERSLEPRMAVSDGTAKLTADMRVTFDPTITMTLRSNHTSPFVTKLGFEMDGKINLYMRTLLDLDVKRSGSVQGPSGIQATSLPLLSSPFCVDIGSVCVPGMLGFGASWSYDMKYDVYSPDFSSHISVSHEYVTSGNLTAGVLWRNGVGNEFIKDARLNSRQELPYTKFKSESKIRGRTCSLEASLEPKFQMKWPSSYRLPDHVTTMVPSFINNKLLSTSIKTKLSSSITMEIETNLEATWKATECSAGCALEKKLEMNSMAGVTGVKGSIDLSLRNVKVTEKLQPLQSSKFVDVVSGVCMKQDTDCPCECPGRASCEEKWNIQRCLACPSTASYCSAPCPAHTVEYYNHRKGKVECKCHCADFNLAVVQKDGSCKCGCTCQDGSKSTIGSNGQCDCSCKCRNCEDSTRGPSGCICPNDNCPSCGEGMEAVWQDCVCSCQSKQGRGGLPPVCAAGWRGPSCDVPDCSPWPYCSDNGVCTVPSGNRADQHPYCVCQPQWIGRGCHIARPRRGAGDPHLETIDGVSYDYFDIGEFWYCKSPENDFGIASRFFKYQRASLIGAVAVKTGHSVVTITTPHSPSPRDLPVVRIDGTILQLSERIEETLAEGKVHLEATLYQNSSSQANINDSGTMLALIAFQWINEVYLSVEVRYSPGMQRQFINVLFSPVASFKGKTEGLCGYMDGDTSNDLLGADGITYSRNDTVTFARTWRITQTFSGSGLNGTWSWTHSNFHKDDVMDISYTDPSFVPLYTIDDLDPTVKDMARSLCLQLGLSGVKLDECIFDVAVTNDSSLAEQEPFQIGCPTQCSGKGRCVNGSCVCISGWFGDDCSRGSCANCSINGDCLSGFCHCHFGWDGPFCERPATCYGVSNCTNSSHGQCKSDDVCECTPGYIGATCYEKARCDNVNHCSGHGMCVDHDKCRCDMGWAGVNCTVFSCEAHAYCSGHGSCVGFDVCQCQFGWGGGSCAIPLCTGVADCSGNGDCIAPDVCQCYEGYSATDCSTPDSCPELNDCSANGVCVSDGGVKRCRCYSGYSGQNCSEAVCKGRNDCSGHGRCVEVDLCECNYGYSDANCSAYSCEKYQFCSGHGSCLSFDRCLCDAQWSGLACDIPDCSGVNNCTDTSHGTCIRPDTCLCEAQYDGDSCDQLALQNANAPTFGMSHADIVLVTTARVASTIGAFPAKDSDSGKNGRLSYSLTSSTNNHTYFRVNDSSAQITLAKSLSLLLGSKLVFQLIVTDEGVPPLAASLDIEVTVVEANKYCPVFEHLPSIVSVPEDAKIGYVVVEATATDADGNDSVNGMVTYSFAVELQGTGNQTTDQNATQSGVPSDTDSFSIDKNSGQITSRRSLLDDTYILQVVASDHGSPQCSTTATVQVNVLSSNTPPICEPSSVAQSLPYTAAVGSVILQMSASDPDSGDDGRLVYSLSDFGSSFLRHVSPFKLTQHNRTAYLNLSSPLRGLENDNSTSYDASLVLNVRDSARRPRSCSYTITLLITHPFDFKDSFLSSSITENTKRGSVLTVTPPLQLLTNLTGVVYSLYNADDLPFTVHPTTGTVLVSGLLDYEAVTEYDINIVAQTNVVSQAFAVASLRVAVKDQNDNPPRFPFDRYTVYVREDAKGGQRLLSLTASDADSVGGPVAYSYTAPDADNVFAVSTSSSGVTIVLDTNAMLNYQRKSRYELVIKAWDTTNASLFSLVYVTIRVEKADFPTPIFSQRSYIQALRENTPRGETVLSIPALVSGKLNDNVTYSIVSQVTNTGVDVAAFDVSAGGNIIVSDTSVLDYETVRTITFTLTATIERPRHRSTQTTVTVELEDVNDNPPVFSEQTYDGTVKLDDPVGTSVLNVTAQDADSGINGQIAYDIVSGNEDGLFSITTSGEMKLADHLDENDHEKYLVTISARDHGQPALSTTTTATVTVVCSATRVCPQPTAEAKRGGAALAAAVGGSAGGVLLIILIVVILVLVMKTRRNQGRKPNSLYSELTPHGSRTQVSNPLYDAQAGDEMAENDTARYESPDQVKPAASDHDNMKTDRPVHKEPIYEKAEW